MKWFLAPTVQTWEKASAAGCLALVWGGLIFACVHHWMFP
jgi:hypothetical protein